ncbi:MAG: GspH/FimT family pseudopilin [Pirellulales bacterium]
MPLHTPRIAPRSSSQRTTSRGFTLVELLVVIVILTIVTAATIPLLRPPSADRKVREAAREFATTFELARGQAIESGRPAGVRIEYTAPATGQPAVAQRIYLCEVPLPYSGDTTGSVARTQSGQVTNISNAGQLALICKFGDLIRFNGRGPYYIIGNASQYGTSLSLPFSLQAPNGGYAMPVDSDVNTFQNLPPAGQGVDAADRVGQQRAAAGR